MIIAFVTFRRSGHDATRYPHLYRDFSISGTMFDGWTAPGNGEPSRHMFISLSRIESIEFWESVGSFG